MAFISIVNVYLNYHTTIRILYKGTALKRLIIITNRIRVLNLKYISYLIITKMKKLQIFNKFLFFAKSLKFLFDFETI